MIQNPGVHIHRPTVIAGQTICEDCRAALIDPILTEGDPRFGRQEFPEHLLDTNVWDDDPNRDEPWWMDMVEPPLPFVLVDAWEDKNMPPAPYVELVSYGSNIHNLSDWVELFSVLGRMVS